MTNKNLRTILIVFAVLAVAAGLLSLNRSKKVAKSTADEVGKNLFPDFPINDANLVTMKTAKEEVNMVKTGEDWGIKERDNYAADTIKIRELLTDIWESKVLNVDKIGDSQLAQLKLKNPGDQGTKEEEQGIHVTVKNGDKELANLTLGKDITAKSGEPSMMGMDFSSNVGRFVRVAGRDGQVYRVKKTYSITNNELKEWLDNTFVKPSGSIKAFAVTTDGADASWSVSRDKDGADVALAEAASIKEIDADKVKQAGSASMPSSFSDVAPAADKDKSGIEGTKRSAKISYLDGFTYDVKVGKQAKADDANSDYYVSFNVSFTAPPEPAPPAEPAATPAPEPNKPAENETPEQKSEREKKDADAKKKWEDDSAAAKKKWEDDKKAAKEKWEKDNKEKAERLTNEKKLEGKTYLVSKSSVEWLTRDRSYFSKTPAAAPPANGAVNPGAPTGAAAPAPAGLPGGAPKPKVEAKPKLEVVSDPVEISPKPKAETPITPPKPKIEAVTPPIEVPPAPPKNAKAEAVTPPVAIPPVPKEGKIEAVSPPVAIPPVEPPKTPEAPNPEK